MTKKMLPVLLSSIALLITLVAMPFMTACAPAAGPSPTPGTTPTPAPAAGEIVWKGQSLFPAEDLCHKLQCLGIVNTLNDRLKGKFRIEMSLPDQIVPVPEQFTACSQGVFEVNMSAFAFDSQWVPEAMIAFGLPGSYENVDQCYDFWHKYGALEFFRESYAKENQYMFRQLPLGRNSLMTKDIIDPWPAGIKGMKIWVEPPQAYPVRDLGGATTYMPLEELYMALKLGTLDGAVYSEPELETLNLYEVINYVYHPSVQEVISVDMTFNLDAWNKLPADLQNQINSIMDEINPEITKEYVAAAADGVKFFEGKGGKVVNLTAEQATNFHKVCRQSWDEIASESPRSAEAVKLLREFMSKAGIP